jgi:hypothetical protein
MRAERPSPGWSARLAARLIRASLLVDRGAALFDRVRSRLVSGLASDAVLDAYNGLAFGESQAYQPESHAFRADWFPWERLALERWFPRAPARVLVGGAGGGRETLQLLDGGYDVVAFEPVVTLAHALGARLASNPAVRVLTGRYEALPALGTLDGQRVSLAELGPFAAGIMGWTSVAHVRSDADRVAAVRRFGAHVEGPILVSVYPPMWRPSPGREVTRWLDADGAVFSPGLGRIQTFDAASFRSLLTRAGMDILQLDTESRIDNWPHAIVRAPGKS